MAKQLKKQLFNKKNSFLTNPKGKHLSNPLDIANEFSGFYAKLYNLTGAERVTSPNQRDITDFLATIHLPSISPTQLDSLSAPFSPEEILKVIK